MDREKTKTCKSLESWFQDTLGDLLQTLLFKSIFFWAIGIKIKLNWKKIN